MKRGRRKGAFNLKNTVRETTSPSELLGLEFSSMRQKRYKVSSRAALIVGFVKEYDDDDN